MSAIIDFFTGLGSVIGSLIDFVIDTIMDIVYMITLLGQVIVQIPSLLGWLPTSVIALIVTIFSIVIIYKIIGREG